MSDVIAVEGQPSGTGLSQVERVVDTFVAPTKTFTDILRNYKLVASVFAAGASDAGDDRSGGEAGRLGTGGGEPDPPESEARGGDGQPHAGAKSQPRCSLSANISRYLSYGSFVLILVFVAIFALIYWASFNFGLGAKTTFGQMFAVCMYASLPRLLIGLLSIVTLLFGNSADAYDREIR